MGLLFFGGNGKGFIVDDESGITTEFGSGTFPANDCRAISYSIPESKAWMVFGDFIVRSYDAIDDTFAVLFAFPQTGFTILTCELQAYYENPSKQYAIVKSATDTRLYKTEDGWVTAALVFQEAVVYSMLSVDSADVDHLLMRNNSSVLRYSTNGGATLNNCNIDEDGASSSLVSCYDVHPFAIYCGVLQVSPNQVSIQKSVDGGATFSIVSRFPDAAGISNLAVSPDNNREILIMISDPLGELHYSVTGGTFFTDTGQTGMSQIGYTARGIPYLINTTGVFESLTAGSTWAQVATTPIGSTAKPTGQLKRWAGHFTGEEPSKAIRVISDGFVWKNQVLTENGDVLEFTFNDNFIFAINSKRTIEYELIYGGITVGIVLIVLGATVGIPVGGAIAVGALSRFLLSMGMSLEAAIAGGILIHRAEIWDPLGSDFFATITNISGGVTIQNGGVGGFVPAIEGQVVLEEDVIKTARGATVLMTLIDGSQFTVEEDRTFTFAGRLNTIPSLPDGSRFAFWKNININWKEITSFGGFRSRFEFLGQSWEVGVDGSSVQVDFDRDFHENKFVAYSPDAAFDLTFNETEYNLEAGEFFLSANSVAPSVVSEIDCQFTVGLQTRSRFKINGVQYTQGQSIDIKDGDVLTIERTSGTQPISSSFIIKVGGVEAGTITFSMSAITPFVMSNLTSLGASLSVIFRDGKINLAFVWDRVVLVDSGVPPNAIEGLNFQQTWSKTADLIAITGIHRLTRPNAQVEVRGFKYVAKQEAAGLLISSVSGRFEVTGENSLTTGESVLLGNTETGPAIAASGSTPYQYHQVSSRYRGQTSAEESDLEPATTE